MAGQHMVFDVSSIVTETAGVTAGYGVILDTTLEDGVKYPTSNNSNLFAGVMMQTVSAANVTAGKNQVERRVLGNAEAKISANVTLGQYGYLLTTGKFAPIAAGASVTEYYACVRFLRAGSTNDLVPAEVICPPKYMQI